MNIARLLGVLGSLGGLLFCIYFLFNNPYVGGPPPEDVLASFSLSYFLPMIIGLYASRSFKPILLLICAIWSFPLTLYLAATPGVLKWLVISPVFLMSAAIIMFRKRKHSHNEVSLNDEK
ncbi:hypothetical protein [Neobacillus citreus]|uniref:Uncharacterized protein n=1 Tax=Neobacillus citreus TaxID=2833578 RepID=A0A942YDH0_9BACI|nr:hypothetical protein [Neobacillus citreus]MCH6269662.1 hypothetical protein [Neobacillus citreus]